MFTIRRAGPEDVERIVALVESAYRGPASREGWTTEADWLDGVRTNAAEVDGIIAGPASLFLLVEDPAAGGVAGEGAEPVLEASCELERRDDGIAYFGMFAVRPVRQGRGIGKLLLAEAERYAAREWGAGVMEMTVINVRGELIEWYARRGYAPTGETRPWPYGDPTFGLPKVSHLAFTVLAKPLDVEPLDAGPLGSGVQPPRG